MSTAAVETAVVIPSPRPSGSLADGAVSVLPALHVPEASQWLSSSAGRVALDGYSWMQAVHWVAGSGLYEPRRYRSHGPRAFGPTTVRVAQELAALSPCRPGIEYLARRTGLSHRMVEYHLQMLRETGLLAYIVRGTRVRGESAQASEFALVVPPEFDAALGIRTVLRDDAAPAYTRAVTGIAEAGRELIAALGRKASRKVRKPKVKPSPKSTKTVSKTPSKGTPEGADGASKAAVSEVARCTPMGGGCSSCSTTGTTSLPPETTDVASGKSESSTRKQSGDKARRGINLVGRRYQLAAELIREIPWLGRASTPRIAWIVRGVADAGWTADEVIAFLDCGDAPGTVHRPSGFLAGRLKTATAQWPHAEGRARAVQAYRDSRRAEQARHQEWEGAWAPPRSESVRRLVADAFTPKQPQYDVPDDHQDAGETGPDVPGEEELKEFRATAWQEYMLGRPDQVITTLDTLGPAAAEQIYGADLVRRVRKLVSGTSLMTVGRR